jgi:transposase
MYVRKTTRKNRDGSSVSYYQLAHNERDPITKKSTVNIIYSLGRVDKLDVEALRRLCESIARVCGLQVIKLPDELGCANDDIREIVKKVKFIGTYEIGEIAIIEALWERLGIGKIFRKIAGSTGANVLYERALLAMTANRLCEPESKLGVWDRWLRKVYLPSCNGLKLGQMYRGMDFFFDHYVEVEKSVFFNTANLFNLEVDLIFYDTTTVSFSTDEEDEEEIEEGAVRKYGYAKEGFWSPQVVVALAVTREGFPVRCWVFPGNTTDSDTIKRVRSDLRGWKLGRTLFVADAGINSESNRSELARACGKYILATRMASVSEVKRDVLSRRGRFSKIRDNLQAKEVVLGNGERRRRYILCYNPQEAERQKKHRSELVKRLEEIIDSHSDRKVTNQWVIELQASRRFKRYLTVTKGNKIRIDRSKVRAASRYDGKWVIETNDDTISFEDAAFGYKSLLVIEQCFRSLKKTRIKLNPVYHWLPRRIESHIRICVLSLLIQRVAEVSCGKTWAKIHSLLSELKVTECHTPDHIFFKLNEVRKEVAGIFNSLEIPLPKGVLGINPRPDSKKNL